MRGSSLGFREEWSMRKRPQRSPSASFVYFAARELRAGELALAQNVAEHAPRVAKSEVRDITRFGHGRDIRCLQRRRIPALFKVVRCEMRAVEVSKDKPLAAVRVFWP